MLGAVGFGLYKFRVSGYWAVGCLGFSGSGKPRTYENPYGNRREPERTRKRNRMLSHSTLQGSITSLRISIWGFCTLFGETRPTSHHGWTSRDEIRSDVDGFLEVSPGVSKRLTCHRYVDIKPQLRRKGSTCYWFRV